MGVIALLCLGACFGLLLPPHIIMWGGTSAAAAAPGSLEAMNAAIYARVYYGIFNNVDQPGSDWDIDGGDCRVQNAVYSQGKVYTTFGMEWDGSRSTWALTWARSAPTWC